MRLAALQLADAVRPKLAPREDGSVPTWREAVAALHPSVGVSASTVPFTAYAFYDGTQRAPAGAGRALTYNGCGVAVSEVTVNALTGEVRVDRADIMLDAAHSLNQHSPCCGCEVNCFLELGINARFSLHIGCFSNYTLPMTIDRKRQAKEFSLDLWSIVHRPLVK